MTTAGTIVTAAYREANLVPISGAPSTNESAEGLARLNGIVLSTIGLEAGTELRDLQIGGTYDQSSAASTAVPANSRLVLELASARTLYLNPQPYDGERVAVADAKANLASANLTLNGNGRMIEGATTAVLATNSLARQWLYRADTGNWVRVSGLATGDEMPFPVEFDDYFITSLALRLAPRNSAAFPQESMAALTRQRSLIRARYRKPRPLQDSGALGLFGSSGGTGGDLLR